MGFLQHGFGLKGSWKRDPLSDPVGLEDCRGFDLQVCTLKRLRI